MGGMNRGRRGGGPTKEATGSIVLDVNRSMRLGAGAAAWRVTMNVTLGRDDPHPITMLVRVDRAAGTGVLRVPYDLHDISRRTGPQDQEIPLRAIPCGRVPAGGVGGGHRGEPG